MLMSEKEYILAQCRNHGIDPNSIAKVKSGKDAGKIYDCHKVKPAGIFEPPVIKSVAQIHNSETKHNKASTNYMHYAHTNFARVLDIIDTVPDAIVAHLFRDDEHANQVLALEILQAIEKNFATLHATNVIKITTIFDAPNHTGATINEYLCCQNDCIEKLCDTKFAFNMHTTILTCVHHMELLHQLILQVRTWNEKPDIKHTWPNFCTLFTDAM